MFMFKELDHEFKIFLMHCGPLRGPAGRTALILTTQKQCLIELQTFQIKWFKINYKPKENY